MTIEELEYAKTTTTFALDTLRLKRLLFVGALLLVTSLAALTVKDLASGASSGIQAGITLAGMLASPYIFARIITIRAAIAEHRSTLAAVIDELAEHDGRTSLEEGTLR